jgi:hypothetical protein
MKGSFLLLLLPGRQFGIRERALCIMYAHCRKFGVRNANPRTYGGYPERQWVALPQSMECSVSDCSFPDTNGAL